MKNMLRAFAVIAVAVTMLAICVSVGDVRITCNLPNTQSAPQAISAALDDLSRPVVAFLSGTAHAAGCGLRTPGADPQQRVLPDVPMSHPLHHHPHGRQLSS